MSLEASYRYPRVKVLKIVDGDTFDGEVDVGFHLKATIRFRLFEYEAPESIGIEAKIGRIASAALARLMQVGSIVEVYSFKSDSFGRWLARPFTDAGLDVVKLLVSQGYGKYRVPGSNRPTFDASTYPIT